MGGVTRAAAGVTSVACGADVVGQICVSILFIGATAQLPTQRLVAAVWEGRGALAAGGQVWSV
jgi:hypothetical protein